VDEIWYADGVLLNSGPVQDISYDSTQSNTPPKVGTNSQIYRRHGTVYRPKYYDQGTFTLNLWSYQGTREEMLDHYRKTLRVLDRADGLVKYERQMEDGTRHYFCYGELLAAVQPAFLGPTGLSYAIAVTVPGAFWTSTETITVSTTAGSGSPQTLDLVGLEDSTAPIDDALITVTGPITHPIIEVVRDDNAAVTEQVKYMGVVDSGQTLTLDSGDWSISTTGGLDVDPSDIYYEGPKYLTIQPPRPDATSDYTQVTLSGTGTGSTTQLTISASSKVTT